MSVTRQHAEDLRRASEIAADLRQELAALRASHERLRTAAEAAANCLMNFDLGTQGRARAQDIWDALEEEGK